MLVIRLIRIGKKNAPSFRVILVEKTAGPQSGKFLEILGDYNPRLKKINLKTERIKYWLSQGAKASATVHNLLIKYGVIKGQKIKKKIKIEKTMDEIEKEEMAPAEAEAPAEQGTEPKAETPVEEPSVEEPSIEEGEEKKEEI